MSFASYPLILAPQFIHFTYWSNGQSSFWVGSSDRSRMGAEEESLPGPSAACSRNPSSASSPGGGPMLRRRVMGRRGNDEEPGRGRGGRRRDTLVACTVDRTSE